MLMTWLAFQTSRIVQFCEIIGSGGLPNPFSRSLEIPRHISVQGNPVLSLQNIRSLNHNTQKKTGEINDGLPTRPLRHPVKGTYARFFSRLCA